MRTLRVATFNLESLDDDPARVPLAARIAALRPRLLRLRADVLCLQEVNAQRPRGGGGRRLDALDRLLEATPYAGFDRAAAGAGVDGGLADVHNLVVLSRLPVLAARGVRHELVPPPSWTWLGRQEVDGPEEAAPSPVTWDRPILHATLDLGAGRRLEVVNLHLRAPLAAPVPGAKAGPFRWHSVAGWAEGFYLAAMKRSGQALEARLLVERLFDADPDAAILVAGDFNCDAREVPFKIIRGGADDTGNPGLAGRALSALERGIESGRRFTVRHGGEAMMLDHLQVSQRLLGWYRGAEVHNEDLDDEVLAADRMPASPESMHAPVVAEFALPCPEG